MGGPAKSQLVHEVDALGGIIGKMADRCYLQKRVLNRSKVCSPALCGSPPMQLTSAHCLGGRPLVQVCFGQWLWNTPLFSVLRRNPLPGQYSSIAVQLLRPPCL